MDIPWTSPYKVFRKVKDMKTSLATTLSVVGVLAAGSVAFAVNTSVLDSATQEPNASQALEATITDIATGSSSPVSGQSADTVVPLLPAEGATAVQTTYNINGVAVVTLSQDGDLLSVVNVVPSAGYTYKAMNESASRVEIKFTNGTSTMKFHADIIDNRIVTSVMNEPQASGVSPRPHSHDEEHEEEHEQEHEEGEHDDD